VALSAFAIALDGPAASGKSTVGLGVARVLGYRYFDTGLLYRALTWLALERNVEPSDAAALLELTAQLDLDVTPDGRVRRDGLELTPMLHEPRIDAHVSTVSAHPSVRTALVPVQRAMVQPPGLVMAGRDIGTVILPDAPLKIWLSASIDERARRRATQTGEPLADVLDRMAYRDQVDRSRQAAPMMRASDAVDVPTDGVPPEQVIASIVKLARARGAREVRDEDRARR
jgi:cytidylate kinase